MKVHGKRRDQMGCFPRKDITPKGGILIYSVSLLLFFISLQPGTANAGDISFVNEVGMEFILVKPGSYIMGSPVNEPFRSTNEPQHRVEIKKTFYMQATEVTLKQWHSIIPIHERVFGPVKGLMICR